MQKKSKKQKFLLPFFAAIFAVVSFYTVLSLAPSLLQAQSFDYEKRAKDDATKNIARSTDKYVFKDVDIVEAAFPHNKKGCLSKASMFLAATKSYKDGKSVDEIVPMKAFRPIFEEFYVVLRDKDIGKASLENLDNFQSCVKTAEPMRNAQREKEAQIQFAACDGLSDVILDILGSIKRRQKLDTIFNRYKKRRLDLNGTSFESIENPAAFFASQLYSTAHKKSYDDAAEMGATLALSCYM